MPAIMFAAGLSSRYLRRENRYVGIGSRVSSPSSVRQITSSTGKVHSRCCCRIPSRCGQCSGTSLAARPSNCRRKLKSTRLGDPKEIELKTERFFPVGMIFRTGFINTTAAQGQFRGHCISEVLYPSTLEDCLSSMNLPPCLVGSGSRVYSSVCRYTAKLCCADTIIGPLHADDSYLFLETGIPSSTRWPTSTCSTKYRCASCFDRASYVHSV